MSSFTRADHATKWISVRNISVVWAQAQRGLNEREARRLAEDFDPDAFGVVVVTLPNGNGLHHCIDGQTRVAAARIALGEDQTVPCKVIETTDPKRAADIFSKMNSGRSKPQAIERFRVAVTAGYTVESEVNKLLTDLGYHVRGGDADGSFHAVATACSIYRRHGIHVLRDALLLIRQTWDKSPEAVNGTVIAGYAAFLGEFGRKFDGERLVNRMQKAYTPAKLLGVAKANREMAGGNLVACVKRILLTTYNNGLRTGLIGNTKPGARYE